MKSNQMIAVLPLKDSPARILKKYSEVGEEGVNPPLKSRYFLPFHQFILHIRKRGTIRVRTEF
jgi:hypothetical protein